MVRLCRALVQRPLMELSQDSFTEVEALPPDPYWHSSLPKEAVTPVTALNYG